MSRRSNLDKGSVTGGLINEAYKDVKLVADNLDAILTASNTVLTFNGTFYAPRASEINFDDLGSPSTIGDSYFNTAMGIQRVFNGTSWQDIGEIIRIYAARAVETNLDDLGNPSQEGDTYFNTAMNHQRVYDGVNWSNMGSSPFFYEPRAIETNVRDNGTASVLGDTYYNTILLTQRVYQGSSVWVNQGAVATDAAAVGIIDTGTYYIVDNVENALQEVGAEFAALPSLTEILSNKELESPVINTPTINGIDGYGMTMLVTPTLLWSSTSNSSVARTTLSDAVLGAADAKIAILSLRLEGQSTTTVEVFGRMRIGHPDIVTFGDGQECLFIQTDSSWFYPVEDNAQIHVLLDANNDFDYEVIRGGAPTTQASAQIYLVGYYI